MSYTNVVSSRGFAVVSDQTEQVVEAQTHYFTGVGRMCGLVEVFPLPLFCEMLNPSRDIHKCSDLAPLICDLHPP